MWGVDEFHNFGSRKAEHRRSNYYKYYLSQFLCSILAYVNLTLYFAPEISIGRVQYGGFLVAKQREPTGMPPIK